MPKTRPKGVVDGEQVNIPALKHIRDVGSRSCRLSRLPQGVYDPDIDREPTKKTVL